MELIRLISYTWTYVREKTRDRVSHRREKRQSFFHDRNVNSRIIEWFKIFLVGERRHRYNLLIWLVSEPNFHILRRKA